MARVAELDAVAALTAAQPSDASGGTSSTSGGSPARGNTEAAPATEAPDSASSVSADEASLLARVRAGDEAAFGTLFARHWETVYRVALRLAGTPEAAEDLAQEAFVQLHRRPPGAGTTPHVRAWLCRVAVNLALNALRSERRRTRREEAHAAGVAEPAQDDGVTADAALTAVLASEERAAVRQVLMSLPERQRVCLLLRYQGLSYAEVAAALGVAPSSVGTLLARAEAAFKERYLEQRGGL